MFVYLVFSRKAAYTRLGRRRKIRCVFRTGDDSSCIGCLNRQVPCTSQTEFLRAVTEEQTRPNVRERLARLERQMEQVLQGQAMEDAGNITDSPSETIRSTQDLVLGAISQPSYQSIDTQISATAAGVTTAGSIPAFQDTNICQELLTDLPTQEDLAHILKPVEPWWRNWQLVLYPFNLIEGNTFLECVIIGLDHDDPVRVAVAVLYIASAIQQIRPGGPEPSIQLPNLGIQLVIRYLRKVERLVIADTALASSYTGLGAILLAAKLNVDLGQLQQAWTLYHRALTLMELMRWHRKRRLSPQETDVDLERRSGIWSMFTQGDKILSLLLGLPCGNTDDPYEPTVRVTSEEPSSLRNSLARIAGEVIRRNQADTEVPDTVTQDIEGRLAEIGGAIKPPSYLDELAEHSDERNEGLMTQFMYNQIRLFLHLPFALDPGDHGRQGFSVFRCFHAARDLCRTYHSMRDDKGAAFWLSKIIDHLGFITAVVMILLLKGPARSLLRPCDIQDPSNWKLINKTTDILRQVAIEYAGASASQAVKTIEDLLDESHYVDGQGPKQLVIPYIGIISIPSQPSSDGLLSTISREASTTSNLRTSEKDSERTLAAANQTHTRNEQHHVNTINVASGVDIDQPPSPPLLHADFEWDNTFDWGLEVDWFLSHELSGPVAYEMQNP